MSTEPVCRETGRTPLEFANSRIQMLKMAPKHPNIKNFKIIEEPTIVTIGNREAVHFIYEIEFMTTRKELAKRISSAYIFMKDRIFYCLGFEDTPDNFDNNVKVFESSVKTFVLE